MNTTTTHVVEGIDLPTYESGFTDQGYLHLGGGVKITVPDRHVEWLRQLAAAAEGAVQRIEARATKVDLPHPGTWMPGDRVRDCFGDVHTRLDDTDDRWEFVSPATHNPVTCWTDEDINAEFENCTATVVHLVPREGGAS